MPTFKVHVVFTVPTAEEQDAVEYVNDLLNEADALSGSEVDWDIPEVWEVDEEEDEEEFVMDEW